jgi:hypothetical protein
MTHISFFIIFRNVKEQSRFSEDKLFVQAHVQIDLCVCVCEEIYEHNLTICR